MSDDSLLKNGKKAALRILERMRGPALVLLRSATPWFERADAQPTVKIRNDKGQTFDPSPTPRAPVLTLGTGGFQLSMDIQDGDPALGVPLESDHTNYLATGKVSDPASSRVHDVGLTTVLPFRWLGDKIAALSGELYLGHPGKKFHLKFNRDQLKIELEWPTGQGRLELGFGASLGAARETDPVEATVGIGGFKAWAQGVDAALLVAMSENAVPFPPDNVIGKIKSGSGETFIR